MFSVHMGDSRDLPEPQESKGEESNGDGRGFHPQLVSAKGKLEKPGDTQASHWVLEARFRGGDGTYSVSGCRNFLVCIC